VKQSFPIFLYSESIKISLMVFNWTRQGNCISIRSWIQI